MDTKKLIVNADDFGQSEGINKGIIHAFENGILTSASLMVRYAHAKHAAQYANENNLDLGLHVDLGEWILKDGNWITVYEVVPQENIELVKEEIHKQLDSFIQITGKKPTHIDSHQHVHKQQSIQPLFLEIARDLNITLRRCSDKVNYCGGFYGQNSDGSPNHHSIGVGNLIDLIATLPTGITEVACHPGLEVTIQTMYKIEREIEVNSLCSLEAQEAITRLKVELVSFAGIPF